MRRLLLLLVFVAGCGTENKTHCETASDCLNGDQCVGGTCQGAGDDACGATHDKCAANASCVTDNDKLVCACESGFTGDGLTCADVDECSAAQPVCAAHATCTNQPGSFACACDADFVGDGSYCVPSKFKKVIAAGTFSCGLADDGGIYCWGVNFNGVLGNGNLVAQPRPVQVGTATDWIDIQARAIEACGLRADHSLWCWGLGLSGQLGDGNQLTSFTPVQVVSDKPGLGWKSVSLGRTGAACALHTDGSAACWGLDRATNTTVTKPVAVDASTDWTVISAGTVRCGLRAAGHMFCWGRGDEGELGLGDVKIQATPTQVGTDTWRTVHVGYYNVCGIRSDGALLCWGNNPLTTSLQYGNTPTQVGTATDWESITVSSESMTGLRAGGAAYGWGDNYFGQLAQPLSLAVSDPTPLDSTLVWNQISVGNTHGCGVVDGQAYCWGDIGQGLLGNGETTTLVTPTRIGDEHWTSLSSDSGGLRGVRSDGALMSSGYDLVAGVGFGNTDPVGAPARIGSERWDSVVEAQDGSGLSCALRDGAPYCWGENVYGQAGVGTQVPVLSPTAVHVPGGARWTEIAPGQHTCAIRSDGALFCWGNNEQGELGNGTTSFTPTTEPPTTPVGETWRHVAVASSATCGVRSDHSLWCWGADQPATPNVKHLVPTRIDTATDWDSIVMHAGSLEICALKTDHTLWCWGTTYDQTGALTAINTPTKVGTDASWKTVSLGAERCGVKADGTLWCWYNAGPLGDGTPATLDLNGDPVVTLVPTQIGTDTDWKAVSSGGSVCGLKTDGSVLCWGLGAAPGTGVRTTPVAVK